MEAVAEDIKVPELRFPEFSMQWEEYRLGNLVAVNTGCRDTQDGCPSGRYPFYVRSSRVGFIDSYSLEGDAILTSGDGVGVGKDFHFASGRYDVHQRVYVLNNFQDCVVPRFLYQWFSSRFYFRVRRLSAKNSVDSVRKSMITEMRCPLPNVEEQGKVAEFLTAVDEKIAKLKRKKELLEEYKKGMMQKLFSQEIRFKDDDGNDFPDWEERRLGEVSRIYDGTHQTPRYVKSGIPFYSVEHVTSGDFSRTKFIEPIVHERECRRVKMDQGDVLMTRIGSVGVPKLIDWKVEASFYVSLALIKPQNCLLGSYLCQSIAAPSTQREIWRRQIHAAFPKKINLGDIGKVIFHLPSIPEQQKIAEFLTGMDDKITSVANQINKAAEFKRGLLQKMFV